jgi:nucleotide-binding universal stress UspA family protein
MGTTAYSVIKQAPCPVLTVPPNKKWLDFSNILFPVRNISGNLDKYAFLRKIIRNNNSTLHIVGLPDNQGDLAKKRIANSILQLKSKLRFDGVEHLTQRLEPNSRVAETVLNIAQKLHADLIAITATLDYSLRDYFIGPYTQQIVHHAQVPILSIRPHTPLKSKADTLLSISPEYQAVASNLSF